MLASRWASGAGMMTIRKEPPASKDGITDFRCVLRISGLTPPARQALDRPAAAVPPCAAPPCV
jgi:hypothetical protein